MRKNIFYRLNFLNIIIFILSIFILINGLRIAVDNHKNNYDKSEISENAVKDYNAPSRASIELWSAAFGFYNTPPNFINSQNSESAASAQNSDLSNNYLLIGTITGSREFASALILKKNENLQSTKKIGDKIEDFKITEINRNNIVLVNSFKKKIILKTDALQKLENAKYNFEKSDLQNIKVENRSIAAPPPFVMENIGAQTLNFTRDEINNLIYNDLEKILTTINIVPYFENTTMIGIRINKLEHNSIMAKTFGLRINDIIKSINGRAVDSIEKGMKLWDNLKNENYLILEIIRNDMPLLLTINIK